MKKRNQNIIGNYKLGDLNIDKKEKKERLILQSNIKMKKK